MPHSKEKSGAEGGEGRGEGRTGKQRDRGKEIGSCVEVKFN